MKFSIVTWSLDEIPKKTKDGLLFFWDNEADLTLEDGAKLANYKIGDMVVFRDRDKTNEEEHLYSVESIHKNVFGNGLQDEGVLLLLKEIGS